jgi:D-glycero-alpha-D-manno-heptose-7-phosphate kinase
MKIFANAPTRLDIAGGTIDMWPIWAILKKTTTINMALELPSIIEVTIPSSKDSYLLDNKAVDRDRFLNHIVEYYRANYDISEPISIGMTSLYPRKAGLAGSSSVIISLISCFDKYLGYNRSLPDVINFASNLEASFLKHPTGTQDYYPILYGGINAIHYNLEGTTHESIRLNGNIYESLQDSILLIKENGEHNSANLNWELMKKFIDGEEKTINQLESISESSKITYDALMHDDIEGFYQGIAHDMHARILLGNQIVPETICQLANRIKNKVNGIKICGAGGNACVALFCDKDKIKYIAKELRSDGLQVIKAPLREKGIVIDYEM